MSGTAGARETEEFAASLRALKDRSGLSYGVLAKRLHMSTSTLHRYCNGTAVPNEYASVERLARACRATPPELMELHRRWILADEARRRRAEQATPKDAPRNAASPEPTPPKAAPTTPPTAAPPAPTPDSTEQPPTPITTPPPQDSTEPSPRPPTTTPSEHGTEHGDDTPTPPAALDAPQAPTPHDPTPHDPTPHAPAPRRRRRTALIASAAAVAVLGAVGLVVNPPWGGDGEGDPRDRQAAGAPAPHGGTGAGKPAATPSPGEPGGRKRTPSASASAPATASGEAQDGAEREGAPERTGGGDGSGDAPVPVTVGTRPYVYQDPCSQHFLVDSEPEQVGPPASEQDAPRWAAAYGAVSSGEQQVALTVQGTGADTVVLQSLHVRVVSKGAPLAWNDYSMGVGCGGNVSTRSFDVDLDQGSPTVTVKNGQRAFPYSVSESDPEVFYVTAHTKAHDVRWYLTLEWSNGSRRGTVRIDDKGTPFRTSADVGRPGYDYPLGGSDWIERQGG